MWASGGDSIDTVKVLLEAKADPNITTEVKLHYSHCMFVPVLANLMGLYIIEWGDRSLLGCPEGERCYNKDVG